MNPMRDLTASEVRNSHKEFIKEHFSECGFKYKRIKEDNEYDLGYGKGDEIFLLPKVGAHEKIAAISTGYSRGGGNSYLGQLRINFHAYKSLHMMAGNKRKIIYKVSDGGGLMAFERNMQIQYEKFTHAFQNYYWPMYENMNTLRDYYEYHKYKFYELNDGSPIYYIVLSLYTRLFEPEKEAFVKNKLELHIEKVRKRVTIDTMKIVNEMVSNYTKAYGKETKESLLEKGIISEQDFVLTPQDPKIFEGLFIGEKIHEDKYMDPEFPEKYAAYREEFRWLFE